MLETLGHPVISLTRLKFGPLSLGALPVGASREATDREIRALRAAVSAAQRSAE